MAPLLGRQFCKLQQPPFHPSRREGVPLSVVDRPIFTPLWLEAWQRALANHPDQVWARAILKGIQDGFRIGLRAHHHCRSSMGNSPSAREQAQVVETYLAGQLAQGHLAGPYAPAECRGIITSSLAVIPKKTPGKWRVIIDLSRPQGASVNEAIRREFTHLAYSSVEDAALIIHDLGPHALLAKVDIKNAYRIVPVHPSDQPFLGIQWKDQVYVDCQLPFGLASAPTIFSALSEALE